MLEKLEAMAVNPVKEEIGQINNIGGIP